MNITHQRLALFAGCAAILLTTASGVSAQAFTYNFTGEPGNQASTAVTTNLAAANVSFSPFTRGSTNLTPDLRANSINSIDWNDANDLGTFAEAIAQNEYYTFTATPTAGSQMTFADFTFGHRRLGQGPDFFALQYIVGVTPTTVVLDQATSANKQIPTIPISGLTNVTTPVEFRLYAYSKNAANVGTIGNAGGGWIIEDTFSGTGTFQPIIIPEANTGLLVGLSLGVGAVGTVIRRKRRVVAG